MSLRRGVAERLVISALLAGLYFVAGKLGLTLAFVNASATAVWPPTGLAIAALLLIGLEVWPAIFIGAFAVNLPSAGWEVQTPFGGVKASGGTGWKEQGIEALDFFCDLRAVQIMP